MTPLTRDALDAPCVRVGKQDSKTVQNRHFENHLFFCSSKDKLSQKPEIKYYRQNHTKSRKTINSAVFSLGVFALRVKSRLSTEKTCNFVSMGTRSLFFIATLKSFIQTPSLSYSKASLHYHPQCR